MKLVNKLNARAFQRAYLTGNQGQRIILDLRFLPTQRVWIADLQLDDFVARGLVVCVSPNLLHSFHNIAPFGMMVITEDGGEPRDVTDFDTGYATIYLMNGEEVLETEEDYFE